MYKLGQNHANPPHVWECGSVNDVSSPDDSSSNNNNKNNHNNVTEMSAA